MTNIQNPLQQMKLEIAAEFGIDNYDEIDKGELPSRVNGKIGGEMTKRLIELGKMQLAQMTQRELVPVVVKREKVMQKQLMLPWPEEHSQDLLPLSNHYNSPNQNYYH
ncbi:MAG: alpha/beta-type small acid-soluble spore protein [Solibacillus sp.]|uniref:alpha/beta-type small acid-soluble spore protein n=1 Tax=unclassified Solibacillus TaxID=2637870 RepID=UPI0030FB1A77